MAIFQTSTFELHSFMILLEWNSEQWLNEMMGFGVDQQSNWITSQNRMDILWTHLDAVGSQTVTRAIPNSYTCVIMNTSVLGMITSLIGSPRPKLAGTAGKGQQGAYTAPGAGGCNVAEAVPLYGGPSNLMVSVSRWSIPLQHGPTRIPPKNHPFPLGSPVSLRHAERRSPTSKRKPTTGNWMPSWRRRLRPSKERRWRWKPTQRWQRCSPRTWTVSGSSKSAGSSSQRGHDALHPTDKKYWTRAFRWVSYIFLGGWDYSSHPPKKSAWWQLDLCRARNMVCLAIKSGWICIYPLVGESLVMVGGAYPMYHVLTGMFGFVWTRERLIPLVQHHKNITILSLTSPFFGASIHKRNWTVKHQKCSIRWDDQLNKPAKWRIASLCIQVGISRRNLQLAHEKHAFPNPKSEKSSILLRWQRKRSRMPWRRHFMGRSRGWDMLGDDSWMNFGKWNGFGTLYFGAKDLDPLVDFGTLVATSSGHFTCHNLVTPYFQIRRNKLSRRPTSRRRLLQPWRRPICDLKPPRLI